MTSNPGSVKRLLPGDAAPALVLSRNLATGAHSPRVVFNETSIVVLWNAGCSGCLPAIATYSRAAKALGVPMYGVAIMVRDLDRTIEIARQTPTDALLAHEQVDPAQGGLSRGLVTRAWLEASGQRGIPAAFLIDRDGKIAWMGPLDDAILDPLRAVFDGVWDVEAARRHWENDVSDNDVIHLGIRRDITDAMLANDLERARSLIDEAERDRPELVHDHEFAMEKLILLAAVPETAAAAGSYYDTCVRTFADDPLQTLSFTDCVLHRKVPVEVFSQAAHDALKRVEHQIDGMADQLIPRLRFHFTSARLCRRLGDEDGYQRCVDALRALAANEITSFDLKQRIAAEIHRLHEER
ncbi:MULTISPECIES: TlpA family protein disulfide reductase [unclassified Shinella]|uniref:TlpA family protein disulfide reductase n=1 Tax=unclassified Shinella TaxID=2643062 RepID=UPI00225CC7B5|nr:hypothetical protein [Shinella sp. YE25]MDC7254596.1 hypothetical protein [Shinella sp. YE25]CAI0337319.1 hypothetical protein SHINE37_41173 [Rhizobiaceae bacterium]CAK7255813.1 protein of unknown function [Shinella sp. WSC3-e]